MGNDKQNMTISSVTVKLVISLVANCFIIFHYKSHNHVAWLHMILIAPDPLKSHCLVIISTLIRNQKSSIYIYMIVEKCHQIKSEGSNKKTATGVLPI